jgi:hypothetical protein
MNPELEHLMGNLARDKGDFNATGAPKRSVYAPRQE